MRKPGRGGSAASTVSNGPAPHSYPQSSFRSGGNTIVEGSAMRVLVLTILAGAGFAGAGFGLWSSEEASGRTLLMTCAEHPLFPSGIERAQISLESERVVRC